MLLAIDTSTNWASLALLDDSRLLAQHSWDIGQHHGEQIFAGLDLLLGAVGAVPGDITGIGVATGPGSFNGVRVAVTCAKTLAFVGGVPLVGIPTLAVLAYTQVGIAQGSSVLALLEAGRGELYSGWYDLNDVALSQSEVRIVAMAEVAAMLHDAAGAQVVGELTPEHLAALVAGGGERITWANPLAPLDRAAALGRLAQVRLAAGNADDVLALEPTYVRRPNITASSRHHVAQPAALPNE